MSISNIVIPNFVGILTNKRKYFEQIFYSVAGVMPKWWNLGIWDGASSTAHSTLVCFEKSVDQYQLASEKPADQAPHYFPLCLKIHAKT